VGRLGLRKPEIAAVRKEADREMSGAVGPDHYGLLAAMEEIP
jgi:hypothetical protein